MKGNPQNELYLAFFTGWKCSELIKKGYNPNTVYGYHRRYKLIVLPRYNKLVKPNVNVGLHQKSA